MLEESKSLVNRVAQSALQQIDLKEFFPNEAIEEFDLAEYLFKGLVLREKDFREALAAMDWEQFDGKVLAVHCSTDAIIPMWAYMLVAAYASPVVLDCFSGTKEAYINRRMTESISSAELSQYADGLILIKGCGDKPIPPSAYVEIVKRLRPIAKSVMFGEACSTVPVFKRRKS